MSEASNYSVNKSLICDDVWSLIKSFIFHNNYEIIQLIEYHTCLPYTLGNHNHKGVEYTFTYLWDNHPDIFDVLSIKEVRCIIDKYNAKMLSLYHQ